MNKNTVSNMVLTILGVLYIIFTGYLVGSIIACEFDTHEPQQVIEEQKRDLSKESPDISFPILSSQPKVEVVCIRTDIINTATSSPVKLEIIQHGYNPKE